MTYLFILKSKISFQVTPACEENKEMEEEMQASQDMKQTNDLENRLQAAVEQIDSLEQQLKESSQWGNKLQKEGECPVLEGMSSIQCGRKLHRKGE